MPAINPDRLLSDLRHLRSIGAQGIGVVRPAFSPKDMNDTAKALLAPYQVLAPF